MSDPGSLISSLITYANRIDDICKQLAKDHKITAVVRHPAEDYGRGAIAQVGDYVGPVRVTFECLANGDGR